ncbi:MAG: S49 family peptidase, partial [Acidobacteria bacterium]|nr:S49 family peptidase [Acidobacteriota bacterium]
MKRRRVFWSGIILFFVVIFAAAALLIRAVTRPPEIRPDSVLEVSIAGEISDGPSHNPIQGLLREGRPSLYDLRRAIDAAAADRRIRAAVVTFQPNDLGWGSAEELYASLQRFRRAGKPLYAIAASDFIGDRDYYLALPASRIMLNPGMGVLVNGTYAEVMFFRKALDKLQVRPEYIQFKEYKSAGETFMRKEMSPEFRESLEYVIHDIENRFVQAVSAARARTPEQVRAFMDTGLTTAAEAKQQG